MYALVTQIVDGLQSCDEWLSRLNRESTSRALRNSIIAFDEIVWTVQDERTFEQKWREAGLGTKLKWKVFGMDNDEN
jgi:hypothetical protein